MKDVPRKVLTWMGHPIPCSSGAGGTVRLSFRAGLAAAMVLGSMVARGDCVPKDNQAAFSTDSNYQGACVVLGIGDYPTATSIGLPNDSISSLRVGSDVQVYACRDENFAGACVIIRGTHPTMANTGMGNDQITSIKVQSIGAGLPCEPGPLQVALYEDANYAGDCRRLPVGDYPTATSTGLPNDSVSSIRVGPGAQVRVCSDAYFAGTCILLTANAPYLGNLPIGNDHLTSAKVRPLGASDSPQDFDSRCSDRTATGKFDCTIHKPIVSRAEWVYQNVVFAPGDKVFVNGDGCVQTGGGGDTWKRYVNPGGGGADHLYHGLVRVPTGRLAGTDVGNTMTRIEHVVGRPITVTGEGVPESQLVLHLGYEDDDYTDNGYDRHDDGSEDQCKGDNGNDGGPAHVTITICRQTAEPCTSMPSRFPFNVLSDQVDPNGFLYNPHWSWQDRPGKRGDVPSGSVCHDFSMRNASTNLGLYNVPNLPDCTDQAGQDTLDVPGDVSVNNVGCTYGATNSPLGGTPAFGGHVNWFPVTVEGTANRVTHEFWDDDYDFSFQVDGANQGSLYLNPGRDYLHAEFDSDETVDHFTTEPWTMFRQAVDDNTKAQAQLKNCQTNPNCPITLQEAQKVADFARNRAEALFVGHAIATGLFGFDGEHGGKTELHPLYALATNVCTLDVSKNECKPERDPKDDVWLMFVRNRGDEGFCSSQIWAGGFDDYTFRLPWREGMTDVEVNWDLTQFEGSQGTSDKPEVRVVPPLFVHLSTATVGVVERLPPGLKDPPGVYVTFHLGYPTVLPASDSSASIPFVDGALHLIWKAPVGVAGGGLTTSGGLVATTSFREGEITPDVEDLLSRAVDHLAPRDRESVRKAGVARSAAPVVHRMSRGVVTRAEGMGGAAPLSRTSHAPGSVAGPVGAAKVKNARDTARIHALCVAAKDKPLGVSESVCKPPRVRDHRRDVRDHR
jgi:Beta/Gamma crystallin